jgi:hypothetical protein
MYRLFSRITRGLDPIADCFKEHVESEGMKLVKEVAEAVEAKKEKDAGGYPRFQGCHAAIQQSPVMSVVTLLSSLLGLVRLEVKAEHVESEGMKLVKEVAEAVEAKKEKDAGGPYLSSCCHVVTQHRCC